MWTTIYPEIVLDDAQKIADDIIQFEMDLLQVKKRLNFHLCLEYSNIYTESKDIACLIFPFQLIQNRTESNSVETYDVEFGDRESDTFANGIETDVSK